MDLLVEEMIVFDMKQMLEINRVHFGVPQALFRGIESQGKSTLHVNLVVVFAGFPRNSETIVELVVKGNAFSDR